MHSLEMIRKLNGQNSKPAHSKGTLKFDKEAGCQVYHPPGFNNNNTRVLQTIKRIKAREAIHGPV